MTDDQDFSGSSSSRRASGSCGGRARRYGAWLAGCVALGVVTMACEDPASLPRADVQRALEEGTCLVQPDWNGIEVLNMNGVWGKWRLRGLPDNQSLLEKRVAPDGSYVAGALGTDFAGVALDGRLLWRLKGVSYSGKPAVSSNAKIVALTSGDGHLTTYDVSTGDLKILQIRGQNPAWQPAGDRLAYDDGTQVRVFEFARGTSIDVGRGTEPSWSSDGTSVAVLVSSKRVDLVNLQTRERRALIEASSYISVPRWSVNGEWMMYTRRGPRHWWSKAEWTGSEPSQIMIRHVKTGTETSIGEFYKANPGDYTWVTNRELCRPALPVR